MSSSKSKIIRNSLSIILLGKLFTKYQSHFSSVLLLFSPRVAMFNAMLKSVFRLLLRLFRDFQYLVLSKSHHDQVKRYLLLFGINVLYLSLLLWYLCRNFKLPTTRHHPSEKKS